MPSIISFLLHGAKRGDLKAGEAPMALYLASDSPQNAISAKPVIKHLAGEKHLHETTMKYQ
jgi:hypothetical protein